MQTEERNKNFIDRDKLYGLIEGKTPAESEIDDILNHALKLQGLDLREVAALLRVEDENAIRKIME